tara:strand:- start:1611 stop:2036 length:426 start_codon:yes stop_codon:yes gene_type:complete
MADRLDYKVSVTAVKEIAASGESLGASVLSADIKGSLGGGNSSGTWAGNDIADWADGVHTHKSSNGGTITTGASCNGVFIKNTGYKVSDGTASTSVVTLTSSITIASLKAGEAIFLPSPGNFTITLSDSSDAVKVEYAIFT